MSLPPYLKIQADAVLLFVRVQPRASRNEICGPIGNELKIRIAAPPVDSAANDELVRFLADVLQCPRGAVQIIRGATGRHKTIAVRDFLATEMYRRLAGEGNPECR